LHQPDDQVETHPEDMPEHQRQPHFTSSSRGATAMAEAEGTPNGRGAPASTGRPGGSTSGRAGRAVEAASSLGDASRATASPPGDRTDRASTPQRARAPEVKPRRSDSGSEKESSSSVGQGSSRGGASSPLSHDWLQRTSTVDEDADDEDQPEQDVEDETESNTQRGGVQPSLKDRNEAPSRELGISGQSGPPGTGRGGPTPPKKSRGTASLVLGVPIPDFVRGRLGPGTVQIVHERVEPSPMPGDPAVPAEVSRRASPESPGRRFTAPPDFAYVVHQYLVALHSSDQRDTGAAGEDARRSPSRPEE
jgi:hypothetical protein